MADIPRLNGAIKALESGKPAFVPFTRGEISNALTISGAPYDGVVFEMEHNPYDIKALRDCLQYMLNRRQIATSGSIAPAVTPFVRIPPNGGENSQWIAKQVLDIGVYGIVWPHVSTVEDARNAVQACRYPRPREAKYYDPPGQRGDAPTHRGALLGPDRAGILSARRHLAAESGGRGAGGDHVRGKARDRQPAEDAGAGARHRRRADRRGRPVAGPRLSAPVRAPDGGVGDQRSPGDLQAVQCARAAIRMWMRRTSRA